MPIALPPGMPMRARLRDRDRVLWRAIGGLLLIGLVALYMRSVTRALNYGGVKKTSPAAFKSSSSSSSVVSAFLSTTRPPQTTTKTVPRPGLGSSLQRNGVGKPMESMDRVTRAPTISGARWHQYVQNLKDDHVFKYKTCVITRVKNEDRILKEWLLYHSILGVEHFFVFDDCSSDDTHRILEGLSTIATHYTYGQDPDTYTIVKKVPSIGNRFANVLGRPGSPGWKLQQLECAEKHKILEGVVLNDLFQLTRPSCEYVGIWDVDEFLVSSLQLPDEFNLYRYMQSTPHGVARFPWFLVGSDGVENRPQGQLVIEAFHRGAFNPFVKCMAKSSITQFWIFSHHPTTIKIPDPSPYMLGTLNVTEWSTVQNSSLPCSRYPIYTVFLKHYAMRSWDEYRRGRGSRKVNPDGSNSPWSTTPRSTWEAGIQQAFNVERLPVVKECVIAEEFSAIMARKVRDRMEKSKA